jgi:subtilisin family serine protease
MVTDRILKLALALFFLFLQNGWAQSGPAKYVVLFTDKDNSPYSVGVPQDFLSQRAIDRRLRQGIPVTTEDLPVNPWYLDSVASKGARILNRLKWQNGVVVECDSLTRIAIDALPFVQSTGRVKRVAGSPGDGVRRKSLRLHSGPIQKGASLLRTASYDYGPSFNQLHLMNAEYLHDHGYKGEGMVIAVLDAGFYQADHIPSLDSLFLDSRVLSTWDFVDDQPGVFEDDTHGLSVLSTIAGILPGQLIGTAPHAAFHLLRSEDAPTENIIEEYNWAAAAEYADSAGADIISSSLGYSTFDDSSMDHTYADMNGNTCPASRAADFAASRGLLVLASAGNQGNSGWHFISAPADGDSVLAVGAVDSSGVKASFSSYGPSSDGDVKPNVAAKGLGTIVSYGDGSNGPGNGTSFACPVLAGAAACLWQAHPGKSNMEVFRAIEQSASYYNMPGDSLGYGIPNFILADLLLGGIIDVLPFEEELMSVYPNPFNDRLEFQFYSRKPQRIQLSLSDALGRIVMVKNLEVSGNSFNNLSLPDLGNLQVGFYLVRLESGEKIYVRKVVRSR